LGAVRALRRAHAVDRDRLVLGGRARGIQEGARRQHPAAIVARRHEPRAQAPRRGGHAHARADARAGVERSVLEPEVAQPPGVEPADSSLRPMRARRKYSFTPSAICFAIEAWNDGFFSSRASLGLLMNAVSTRIEGNSTDFSTTKPACFTPRDSS